jgi:hypothetical protein
MHLVQYCTRNRAKQTTAGGESQIRKEFRPRISNFVMKLKVCDEQESESESTPESMSNRLRSRIDDSQSILDFDDSPTIIHSESISESSVRIDPESATLTASIHDCCLVLIAMIVVES